VKTRGIALGFGLVGLGAVAGTAARGLVSPTPAAAAAPAVAERPVASGVAAEEGRPYPGAEVQVGADGAGASSASS
jgi:hypothetical protein